MDFFVTVDRGIPRQQNLSRYDLTVVVLRARSNSFEELSPLMETVSDLVATAHPGEAVYVEV